MDGVDSTNLSLVQPLPTQPKAAVSGQAAPSQSEACDNPPVDGREQQKKQIAKDFESVLLTKLFDQVKESIGHVSLDDEEEDGAAEQVHGLFWYYLAQDVADKGGFGMWKDIYQNFNGIERARTGGALIDREL